MFEGQNKKIKEILDSSELAKAGLEHKNAQDPGQYYGKRFEPKSPDDAYELTDKQKKVAEEKLKGSSLEKASLEDID